MKLVVDGQEIEAQPGSTVLEAALAAGIYIPNLCYHPDLRPVGACRLCIVEIDGMKGLPTACTTAVRDGMIVRTRTDTLVRLRRNLVWLVLSECPHALDKDTQLKKIVESGKFEGYEPLLVEIVKFFKSGTPPVTAAETLEILAFMEAADRSKQLGGQPVKLAPLLK